MWQPQYHDGNPCPYNKRRFLNAKAMAEGLLRVYPACRNCVKHFTCPVHIGATECPYDYDFKGHKDRSFYPRCVGCRSKEACEKKRISRPPIAALKLNPSEFRKGTLTLNQTVVFR